MAINTNFLFFLKCYSLKKKFMCPREVLTGEMMEPVSLFRNSAGPVSSQEPGWRAAHRQPRSWTTFPHGQTFHMERSLSHFVGFILKPFRCVTGHIITGQLPMKPRGRETAHPLSPQHSAALSREPFLNSRSLSLVCLHHSLRVFK